MTYRMTPELLEIQKSMRCAHCDCTFTGSNKQAFRVKYEKSNVYCSSTCRLAMLSQKFSRPVPERGPCMTCGKTFLSRTDKMFCTMACYIKSDRFKEANALRIAAAVASPKTRAAHEARRTGQEIKCVNCQEKFYRKRADTKKYCSTVCYRADFSKRYDRWVANPESVSMPQCYDEFLDRERLPCVVAGCGWHGKHLTLHMNQKHGVPKDEFKRAVGFNLSTGVVSKPLAQALRQRDLRGVALDDDESRTAAVALAHETLKRTDGKYIRYQSLEAREHAVKARADILATPGPIRLCVGCGTEFQQRHATGRALYCTKPCRDRTYGKRRRAGLTCSVAAQEIPR